MADFGTFHTLVRKAAVFGPALLLFGTASARVALADDPAPQTAASVTVLNNSDYRLFGMVDGVKPKDPFTKDASGNYTNPDAVTAYTALTLYVAGAMRYPIRQETGIGLSINDTFDPDTWDWNHEFEGLDNPGRLTTQYRVDSHGNLASQGGKLTSLVDMFNGGNDRTKAIILATLVAAHDQLEITIRDNMPSADPNTTFAGDRVPDPNGPGYLRKPDGTAIYNYEMEAAEFTTTDETLTGYTRQIAEAPNPFDPAGKEIVMGGIWASSNTILDRAKSHKLPVVISAAQRATEYGDWRGPLVVSLLQANNPGLKVALAPPQPL